MAPKKSRKRRTILKFKPVKRNCVFCKAKDTPSYKDYHTLEKYVSDRSKILGKGRTGVCAKHQRILGREIKRARHLGMLQFTSQ